MTIDLLWSALAAAPVLLSLPGTVELALLTLGGILPCRPPGPPALPHSKGREGDSVPPTGPLSEAVRIAVVVPAHNEEAGIRACVQGLLACDPGAGAFAVVVVADNCTDATAAQATAAGAQVLVRTDSQRRGKGYALDYAFRQLLPQGFDAVLVVDADTRVEPSLITEFQRLFAAGADAVQCRYQVDNPQASLRARLMHVAWLAFNVLRPRGRERWGLSVGLLGNGFGLTRETLAVVPYEAASVTEDLEYHLRLVRAGRRVRFADAATVWSPAPTGGRAAASQRARWEGGRFRMIRELAPPLAREAVLGQPRLLEPLLELLLLPLAYHVFLLLAALALPLAWSRAYALAGLALVVLHVAAAIVVGRGGWRDLLALAAAPFYMLWKLTLVKALTRSARRDAEWVRTEREDSHDR